jgi:hypothetical protein
LWPLAVLDGDLVPGEVNVLHAQAAAFEQAQARTAQEHRHESWHTMKLLEDGANFVPRQHHRQVQGPLGSNDVVEPR